MIFLYSLVANRLSESSIVVKVPTGNEKKGCLNKAGAVLLSRESVEPFFCGHYVAWGGKLLGDLIRGQVGQVFVVRVASLIRARGGR